MRNRDVALIAFKTLALWVIASGLIQALDLALNWHVALGQFTRMNLAPGSPSPTWLVVNALGALLARSGLGVAMWALSGTLARSLFAADDPQYSLPDSIVMYRAAAFLVGLWLLADALPTATFTVVLMVRGGWKSQDSNGIAQLASLWVKLGLGFALLRGGDWIREFFLGKGTPPQEEQSG